MTIREISVQRVGLVSARSFDEVVRRVSSAIGHPEMGDFYREIAAARTFAEVESIVAAATGPSGLMEFLRFDAGDVVRKATGVGDARILRIVVGNPVTMSRMARHVPDAASYAPTTILIDAREDGVHLSYDRMASLLASYGNAEALAVARELDAKVETILNAVA